MRWARTALAALGVAAVAGAAHAGRARFERFDYAAGLPVQAISALTVDRTGFLWVGSRDGLHRYDGYAFSSFVHDPANPRSPSDNVIRSLAEDEDGALWIGTNTAGLNKLTPGTDRFESFRHDLSTAGSLVSDRVVTVEADRRGGLWIATDLGLDRLDRASGTIEHVTLPTHATALHVTALFEDREKRIWAGTAEGAVYRRDPGAGAFAAVSFTGDIALCDNCRAVRDFVEDAAGHIFVGSMSGLYRLDPVSDRLVVVSEVAALSARPVYVTSLAAGRDGRVWAGTYDIGLVELDPRTGRAQLHRARDIEDGSLSDDRIACLAIDGTGSLWIGTWGGGLDRLDPAGDLFRILGRETRPGNGLAWPYVMALHEEGSGDLLVGIAGGLDRQNAATGYVEHVSPPGAAENALGDVFSIAEGPGDTVWLGTLRGLYRTNHNLRTLTVFAHDSADPRSIGAGLVSALLVDRSGTLWAGTAEGGISRLSKDGRSFDRYLSDPNDPATLSDRAITSLLEARDGAIWAGTRSGGLNRLDPKTGRIAWFTPISGQPWSLSHTYVTSLFEGRDGAIWVGTGGGGLDRMETSSGGAIGFRHITEQQGLPDNNVMSIAEDDDGSLWIATRSALARLDPSRGTVSTYRAPRNLPWAEFNANAVARGARHLHFGSLQGIISINRGTPFPAVGSSPTLMTSIKVGAGNIAGTGRRDGTNGAGDDKNGLPAPWARERLDLRYGQPLTLELTVLDLRGSEGHKYGYKMGESSEPWIDVGRQRQILFTDLSPGRHVVRGRGRNSDGVWTEARPLLVNVIPPFWMTTWFRALTLVAVALALLAGHRARTSRLARRNAELVQMERLRAEVLHASQEKERELERSSARLRVLARGLETAKEDERKRIARELHDEMGQALTATKINLQILARTELSEKNTHRLGDAIDLVERMIGHVRALSLDLRPPLMEELGLLPALQAYIAPVATKAGLEFHLVTDDPLPRLPPQLEIVVFRIVQELTTNCIRHSGASRLTISIHVDTDRVRVEGRDDGKGFDVHEVMKRAGQGKHVGLLGMIERARGLEGEVEIETAVGKGATVRVQLPLEA